MDIGGCVFEIVASGLEALTFPDASQPRSIAALIENGVANFWQ
jgi:hypothetical protein